MKSSIRHGGVVRCDMATVSPDGTVHSKECDERFISYSVSSRVREQAALAKWARPRARLVKWPGEPPVDGSKKVDLCPEHSVLVMTSEELKAQKLAEKAKKKEASEAEKKAAKDAQPKKPRAPRKKKAPPSST